MIRWGAVALIFCAGCVQDLLLVPNPPDRGVADRGPVDMGAPDTGFADTGDGADMADAGALDTGSADLGSPIDMGVQPPPCVASGQATLCLPFVQGFVGSEVSVPIELALPTACEGVGRQRGTLIVDPQVLTLTNPEPEGCTRRAQIEDRISWSQIAREDLASCPPLYTAGPKDVLRFFVSESATVSTLVLRWESVDIEASPLPSTCTGTAAVDGQLTIRMP